MDKYLKAIEALEKTKDEYEKTVNKETKTAQNKWEKILKLEDDVNELEKNKDKMVLSK
jgi:Mg2+ and Co2+ transporter CorA